MRFILATFLLSFNLSSEELKLNTSEVCNAVITKRLQSNQDAYKQAIDKINQCKKNDIIKWDGKPLMLASRATDDFGNIQPTIDQETAAVGVESVYHRNAIVTWEINAKGECNNVQVRKHKKS